MTNTDDDDKPRLVSATIAARKLADILKWKIQLQPAYRTPQAFRYDTDHVQGSGESGLPFGLGQVIDSSHLPERHQDYPDEICTPAGVDKWLRYWNPWMNYWTGTPAVYRKHPGPWFLKELQENKVFTNIAGWDDDDQAAWTEYTSELHTVWTRLRQATGNQPRSRTTCPYCQTGTIQQHPGPHGYEDTATCTNCGSQLDYNNADHAASFRAAMRQLDTTIDAWITTREAQIIWPGTPPGTLRRWVHEGHIRKQDGRYNLHDLNQRMRTRATCDTLNA